MSKPILFTEDGGDGFSGNIVCSACNMPVAEDDDEADCAYSIALTAARRWLTMTDKDMSRCVLKCPYWRIYDD